jgi:hypothetical protein
VRRDPLELYRPPGMVVGYSFNNASAKDSGPHGLDGTLTGGTITRHYTGTGSPDKITVTDNAALQITGASVYMFWIKIDTTTQRQNVLCKYNHTSPSSGYAVRVHSDGTLRFTWREDNSNYWSGYTSTVLSVDTWYHFAVCYPGDGNVPSAYINGTESAVTTWLASGDALNGFTSDNGTDLTLGTGQFLGAPLYYLSGSLDDVRIYDRILTSTEISHIYQGGKQGHS